MGGGCTRREALGISTLDSESSDRGSNPREVLCTPARFDELRSVVRAVGVVLLGLGLFAVVGFSAGLCVLDIRLVCGGVRTAGGTLRFFPGAPPRPSANRALRRLTSDRRGGPVHSARHGRQRILMDMAPVQFQFGACVF